MAKDLIFNPSKGISNSPLSENAFSQCIDNDSENGIAKVNYETDKQTVDLSTGYTFTADTGTELLTVSTATEWTTGTAVQFTTSGTLPNPLATSTVYYLRKATTTTFYVHTTFDDAINATSTVNLTTTGSGTHTTTPIEVENIKKFIGSYALDAQGNFWKIVSDGVWELLSKGSGSGNTLEQYKNYIYLCRGGDIDRWLISTETLTASWQTDSATNAIVGQDDVLYFAAGNELRSWDDSTFTSSALDLPEGETITAIAELGRFLAMGTNQNKIFLWDRVSTTFELPISTQGDIEMLIPANNLLYFVIDSGDLYVTNGSSAELVKEFPRHILTNKEYPSFQFQKYGWRVQNRDIYIGYGSTSTVQPMGIYQYSLEDGDFKLAYTVSADTGEETSANKMRIDALQDSKYGAFFIGATRGGSTYLVDRVSLTKRYTSYRAEVRSPFYKVGKRYQTTTYKHTEVSLSEKLKTGQGIRVSYRTDLSASWTTIGTFSTVNKISTVLDKTINNLEYIQLRAELTTNQDEFTPKLLEIRLYD
jgi:hypothetical protein